MQKQSALIPDNTDDFIRSLHPDAVRLQAKNVTEDGVKIPLNFQFAEPLLRKTPTVLPEPVAIAKPRERIVTVDEFDRLVREAEQKRKKPLKRKNEPGTLLCDDVVAEIKQSAKINIETGDAKIVLIYYENQQEPPRGST